ncbi:PKD-like domain-containing protein [Ferruginibacter albus]|uniref:PKD-like domain-containing protein n=1 Tax=Ferruginibacter albus TaxID=2875540 RepID=UPI001CC5FE89|nr:PKD-like domain-containing protein [Ferruginibacter albus]UAY50643.1 hypothetical protein K9M53_08555 [Ferruginibacter albus]
MKQVYPLLPFSVLLYTIRHAETSITTVVLSLLCIILFAVALIFNDYKLRKLRKQARLAFIHHKNTHSLSLYKRAGLVIAFLIGGLFVTTVSLAQTTNTYNSSTTWTCPIGVSSITVECWGAGGAGGGATANPSSGGGGGGGSYVKNTSIAVTPGTTYTITVGAGGSGSTGAGQAGGDSWFGSTTTILAKGGNGGNGASSTNQTATGAAAVTTGNVGATSPFNYYGGAGGTGSSNGGSGGGGGSSAGTGSNGNNASGRNGGSAPTGGFAGADGSTSSGSGSNGGVGAGGAGGKASSSTDRSGGDGGDGRIKITYTVLTYKDAWVSMDLTGGGTFSGTTWCAGETRNVKVTVKNTGTATWTDASPDINIGVKWNTNGTSWNDYNVRVDAAGLAPGATATYTLPVTASNNVGGVYTTPLATGTNKLTFDIAYEGVAWFASNAGGVGPSNVVSTSSSITIVTSPTANSGNALTTCSTSGALNITSGASAANQTSVAWTSSGTGTFANASSLTTATYTPSAADIAAGSVMLTLTAKGSACNVSSSKTLTINTPPTAAVAGAAQSGAATCGTTTVTLGANTPIYGSGLWTITSGTGGSFTDATSPTTTFSGIAGSSYALKWTISQTACTSSSDNTTVSFSQNPTAANAGADQTDAATCGLTTVTLAANAPTVGTGQWSIVSGTGGSFADNLNRSTTFTGVAGNTYTLRWTITSAFCGASTDDVDVAFNVPPTTANAGANQTGNATCGLTTVAMNANTPLVGTGQWSIVSGTGGSFDDVNNPVANFSGAAGNSYTLRWTITNGLCKSTSDVNVTFNTGATLADAGADQGATATCGLTTVTLTGNTPSFGTGQWSIVNGTGGSFSNASNPASTFTGVAGNTYTLRWTITSPCNITSDDVDITFSANPTTANAGANQTAAATCGLTTVTLAANTPTVGTGVWSIQSGTGGTVTDVNNPTSTFSGVAGNTYVLRWTISNSPCTSSFSDVTITFNQLPTTADAGPDQIDAATCGLTTITLAANTPTTGTGKWNIVSGTGGAINNINNPSSTFSGVAGNTYTLRWTVSNSPCTASTDDVVITFNQIPSVSNASTKSICNATSTNIALTASVASNFSWTLGTNVGSITGASASVSPATTINQTLNNSSNSGSGSIQYIVTPTSTIGCVGNPSTITVTVNPTPAVTNTATAATCSGTGPNIGLTASAPSSFAWTLGTNVGTITGATATSGSTINQTLTNPSNANTGSIEYKVTPTSTTGSCAGSPYTITVTVNPKPAVTTATTASTCSGTSPNIGLTASTPSSFAWTLGTNVGTITGASATSGSSINQTLTNPSNSSNGSIQYVVTPTATTGSCVGNTTTITVTVNPKPAVSNAATKSICSGTSTNIGLTASTNSSFSWSIGTITGGITGASAGSGPTGTTINQVLTNPSNSTAGTVQYVITPTSNTGSCAGAPYTITVTVNPLPIVTVSTNYCVGGGVVKLTGNSSITPATYLWTDAETTQAINVDIAGTYAVTGTVTATGCQATASTVVAQELVTNGDFNAGNTGFTSGYANNQSFYTTGTTGLELEGLYAVNNNAHDYHPAFYGTDHTSGGAGTGKFMIVNGSGTASQTIWQQTVTVTPNTTYYFSAWAMSLNQVTPYAQLSFAVNGSVIGTTAVLAAGATSTSGPFNWTRFYGTFDPGNATSVVLSIVDLQTALGGNDFGLDDISCSTLSPATLSVTPQANGGGAVCSGYPLSLTGNQTGGTSPFTYSWTGPSSFNSSTLNPTIASASTSNNGSYSLTVTDAHGCSGTGSVSVSVNTTPSVSNQTTTTCSGTAFSVTPSGTPSGTKYTWGAPTGSGFTGGSQQNTGQTSISQTLTNTTTSPVTATYTVTPTSGAGCVGNTFTVTVTINPKPNMTSASSATICSGSTVSIPLTSDVASSYVWVAASNGNVTGESTSNQSTTTLSNTLTNTTTSVQTVTYTVTPTSTTGSCQGSGQTVTVTVNPMPSVSNQTTSVCTGGTFSVTPGSVPSGTKYTWTAPTGTGFGGGSAQSTAQSSISQVLTNSGTTAVTASYTVTPISGTCTGNNFTLAVTVNPKPTMTSASSATICSGTAVSITLTSDVASSYQWSAASNGNVTGESTSTQTTSTLSNTLTNTSTTAQNVVYTVTPTSTGGSCAGSSQTVTVTVNPKPTVSNQTKTICSNTAFSITPGSVPSGTTYTWTAPSGTGFTGGSAQSTAQSSISQTLVNTNTTAKTATYTVTPTSGTCTGSTFTATITINPEPVMNSVSTVTICSGTSVGLSLSASVTSGYSWVATDNTNITGESLSNQSSSTINNTLTNSSSTTAQTVTYTVTPTSTANSCVGATQTVTVTVNPKPSVSNQSATICSGSTFSVTPTGVPAGMTYTWATPSGSGFTGGSAQSTAQSSISQTLTNSGTSIATATYTVTPKLNGCSGNTFSLPVTINPSLANNNITLTSVCKTSSSSAQVIISQSGTAVSGGDGTYTYSWEFSSPGNSSYAPVSGQTGASLTLSQTANNGFYRRTVTSGGCSSTSGSVHVNINNAVTAADFSVTGGGSYCSGSGGLTVGLNGSVASQAEYYVTYELYKDGIATGNVITGTGSAINFGNQTAAGTYTVQATVTATGGSSCSAIPTTGNVSVSINPLPTDVTAFATATQICTGTSGNIQINNSQTGINYQLRDNATNANIGTAVAGTNGTIILTTGSLSANKAYNVLATNATTSCTLQLSSTISIIVNNVITNNTISNAQTICSGTAPSSLSGTAAAGGNGTNNYLWESSTTSATTGFSNAGGSCNGQQYSPATLTQPTWYRRTVSSGGCFDTSSTVLISINAPGRWLGGSNDWFDDNNWCGGIPVSTTDVLIPTGLANYPVVNSGTAVAHDITIETGASVLLNTATIQVHGSISNSGDLDLQNGTLELKGNVAQAISGGQFVQKTLNNLIISNTSSAGVNLAPLQYDTLKIANSLSFGNVNNATFNTNDNLTLLSTETLTARVADITNNGTNSGNSITGKANIERYIQSHRAWRLLTAPINSAQTISKAWQEGYATTTPVNLQPAITVNVGYGTEITNMLNTVPGSGTGFDAAVTNNPSIKYLSNGGWAVPANTSSFNISSQQGYMLFVRGDRTVVVTKPPFNPSTPTVLRPFGTLNQNNKAVSVAGKGFQIIGNPYASQINFDNLFVADSMRVGSNYYVWDPMMTGTQGVGAFVAVSYNGSAGDYSSVTHLSPFMDGRVESGQAFLFNFIDTGKVTFREQDKNIQTRLVFRPVVTQKFRANLYSINDGNAELDDATLTVFGQQFSNAVSWAEDAQKITNPSENLALMRNGKSMAIEKRPMVTAKDTIYLRITQMQQQGYQFELSPSGLEQTGLKATLIDNFLKTSTPVSLTNDTKVNFTVTADANSQGANRFMIVFDNANRTVPVTFVSVKAWKSNKNVPVQWKVENEINIQQYEVERSTDGKSFTAVAEIPASSVSTYNWLDENAVAGDNYYRIKSIDMNGAALYSSTVKVDMGTITPSIVATVNNATINLQLVNMEKGTYQVRLTDVIGQLIALKSVQHDGTNSTKTISLTKNLSKGVYTIEVISSNNKNTAVKIVY